tara:strand:- start:39 stop:305 length:267 start_codon:yes stop_codon:yes gene_type:complete
MKNNVKIKNELEETIVEIIINIYESDDKTFDKLYINNKNMFKVKGMFSFAINNEKNTCYYVTDFGTFEVVLDDELQDNELEYTIIEFN